MHWKFLKKSRQVIQLAVVTWPRPLAKRFCAPVLWASPEHLSFCSMPASDKLLGEKKWLLKPAPCGSLFSCGGSKKLSCSKKCCFAHDGKNEANISEQQNHGGKKLLEKNTETFVKYSHSYLIAKKKSQWDWKNSCFSRQPTPRSWLPCTTKNQCIFLAWVFFGCFLHCWSCHTESPFVPAGKRHPCFGTGSPEEWFQMCGGLFFCLLNCNFFTKKSHCTVTIVWILQLIE